MSTHKPEQPAPAYVPGHSLLEGRVVVVTAAAGAGIGAAVVRKVLEEGAKAVVISDTHERRLKESRDALAEEFGDDRITAVTCDVTQQDQVEELLAAADAGATAIIQPGGSMRDAEVIAAADERGLAMVFTGMRHFRH